MKIFNETKTQELNIEELDFEKCYLKPDKLFIKHHEAVEAKEAVFKDRVEILPNGSKQVWKDLVTPAVEAKAAYDEYEDIQVYVTYTESERKDRLRRRRETECFPVINRGQLWYDTLTTENKNELKEWYLAWLNVTETFTVPKRPDWLR